MQYKFKLSFSVLMISSCLVQIASAVESKSAALTSMMSVNEGGQVGKGSALITNSLVPSNNITIGDGGVEIVENGKTSIGATIKEGGMQIVTRSGTAMNTNIPGGKQFVFEEKILKLENLEKGSSAYHATVSGGAGGTVGQQNIYDGATAWYTKVGQGGEQNLYTGRRGEGGIAESTIASGNGRQHVLAEGVANNTTLKDGSIQVVYPLGIVDGLTINDNANSWIFVGAEISGEVKVNNQGHLYLLAGDRTNHTTKTKISVEGRADETLFNVGERNNNVKPQIEMEKLGGEGGTVVFTSARYDPRHISLHVGELSGDLHFKFNISTTGGGSDYLVIDDGSGNHTISVADSGAEITGLLSQKNGLTTALNLVTDKSGGANFTLVNHSGEAIEAFDGGTFVYNLQRRERNADSSGDSTTWYLGRETGTSSPSGGSSPRMNRKSKVTIPSPSSSTDANTSSQRRTSSSRSRSRSQSSTFQIPNDQGNSNEKPKDRLPRHLKEVQQPPVSSPRNQAIKLSRPVGNHNSSDEQQQPVVAAGAQTLADQMTVRPSDQEQPPLQSRKEMSVSDFLTTPSTDAVLSMSVAPGLIFHNELQTVRAGRGILDRSKKNAAFWTYAIKSRESVATEHIDFKLEQTGIVLGISGLSELMSGEFYIGGFGSYDQARVAHARGGISGINTYGIGAYATYFDHSGLYLDGVLKYNHYQNDLKAVSTNGVDIEGNYKQWVVGTSFEAGYRFEITQSGWMQPYAQFTWLQAEGKEIKLSNEMTGDISPFTSLRSEVGLSLGYEFGSGIDTSSMVYITAAWLRENKDNNHTTINQQHEFTTDLSGNAGKLGVGLSSLVSEKLKLYAEAHYVKGQKVKQSLQGILGVRYSF
ncbi:BafA family autotransporter [Bartonella jaculi]